MVKNAYFSTTTVYDVDTFIHFIVQMMQFLLWQLPILGILWPHKLKSRGNKGQQSDDVSATQSDNNTSSSFISDVHTPQKHHSASSFEFIEGSRKRSLTEKARELEEAQ